MPYTLKQLLSIWANQFDWSVLHKVTDLVIYAITVAAFVDFLIIFAMKW